MKLSRSFLDSVIDTKGLSNEEIATLMTKVGNEYEAIDGICHATNLVVGKVLECFPHPDSDHLHVCKVDTGDGVRQIVCGAPNVKEGIKVVVALPSAKLPGGEIKSGVIRGEESNGMLCSLAELGLDSKYVTEEDKKGIHILSDDYLVGTDAIEALGFDDTTIDFELTSNRSDLLSVLGMGYEVGAIIGSEVKIPSLDVKSEKEDVNSYVNVDVKTSKCPLYLARVVKDVIIGESPNFIKKRLMASGIRPINNVVDISNYVMLLYGQPLHFFDYDKLGNKIVVRCAKDGEKITTLDKEERILDHDDIVISKGDEAVCLAGVMGGYNTEIDENTKNIVIEAAIFDPLSIRKTAKKTLSSESSLRFERKIDYNRTYMAIDMAVKMLSEYACGTVIKGTVVHDKIDKKENVINLDIKKVSNVLGLELSKEEILDVFKRLDFKASLEKDKIKVIVPSRRLDIAIEEDLIEEIGRIHGIDNIKGKLPSFISVPGKREYLYQKEREIKDILVNKGLHEVITYTLTDKERFDSFNYENKDYYEVLKPISLDRYILRGSLIPSLIDVCLYNNSYSNKDINIFEISNTYTKDGEDTKLSILISGNFFENKLYQTSLKSNFYVLKGIIVDLLNYFGYKGRVLFDTENIFSSFHPYSSANILIDRKEVGVIGKIHPKFKLDAYVCEISLKKLFNNKVKPLKNKEISKYPEIKKDVAFIIDNDISSSLIVDVIKKSGTNYLKEVSEFDIYYDKSLGDNKKSIAYSLTFNSNDRTLEDQEVDKIFRNIIDNVCKKFNAVLRDK